jgi:CDP-4-dehydro-6-deoxyglucose reductase
MPRYIYIDPGGVRLEVQPGRTVLDELRRLGYSHRHGCRRGGCGLCKVDVVRGAVEYNTPIAETVLSRREREVGTCLTCRAVPVGDLEISLRGETLRIFIPWSGTAGVKKDLRGKK